MIHPSRSCSPPLPLSLALPSADAVLPTKTNLRFSAKPLVSSLGLRASLSTAVHEAQPLNFSRAFNTANNLILRREHRAQLPFDVLPLPALRVLLDFRLVPSSITRPELFLALPRLPRRASGTSIPAIYSRGPRIPMPNYRVFVDGIHARRDYIRSRPADNEITRKQALRDRSPLPRGSLRFHFVGRASTLREDSVTNDPANWTDG